MPGPGRPVRCLLLLGALALTPAAARAQLISPGKLSRAHASLDGVGSCTNCHELGKRGADDARCLKCHEPLARRIAAKEGLHATYAGKACAECHKEHFGLEFAVLRFDSTKFDHKQTGYPLVMAHDTASCRSCHQPKYVTVPEAREYATKHAVLAKTYLGLDRHCVGCHAEDDPHVGQFKGRGCDGCHNEATWKEAPRFNHQRTKYPLTGQHLQVACAKCHEPTPPGAPPEQAGYVNLPHAQCTDCHTDPHKGRMRGTCESCHNTGGWRRMGDRRGFEASFDHSLTRFALQGAHRRATCAACHQPRAPGDPAIKLTFAAQAGTQDYPPPAANDCLSCHLDLHKGQFAKSPGGMTCDKCHTVEAWRPTTYDVARHNRETYKLDGAHMAVPCGDCHVRPAPGALPTFRLGAVKCQDCHAKDDKHGDQFGARLCTECHTTATFKIAAFDHSKTRYPLDGAHRDVACASCHHTEQTPHGPVVRYRPLGTQCKACHGAMG